MSLACFPAGLPACIPPCLHACLPVCLFARMPACLPACLPARLPTCLPASLRPSAHPSHVRLFVRPTDRPSVRRPSVIRREAPSVRRAPSQLHSNDTFELQLSLDSSNTVHIERNIQVGGHALALQNRKMAFPKSIEQKGCKKITPSVGPADCAGLLGRI